MLRRRVGVAPITSVVFVLFGVDPEVRRAAGVVGVPGVEGAHRYVSRVGHHVGVVVVVAAVAMAIDAVGVRA